MTGAPLDSKRPRTNRRARLAGLPRDTKGATAIEYGLIVSLIVIAMLASLQSVADITNNMWSNVSSKVVNAH